MAFKLVFDRYTENIQRKLSQINTESIISLVWTRRFFECGDFVMTMPVAKAPRDLNLGQILEAVQGAAVTGAMIIEDIKVRKNENGCNILELSGRGIEAVLERASRLQRPIDFSISVNPPSYSPVPTYKAIQQIFKRLAGRPAVFDPEIIYKENTALTGDTYGQSFSAVDLMYAGNFPDNQKLDINILDMLLTLSHISSQPWGLKATLNWAARQLIVETPLGRNKPGIEFSTENGTLSSLEYEVYLGDKVNQVFVSDEHQNGRQNVCISTPDVTPPGYAAYYRYSACVSVDLKESSDWEAQATAVGKKFLHPASERISCEFSQSPKYAFGRDYDLGDVVTVSTGFGPKVPVRVTEMTFSYSEAGGYWYPTFAEE